MIISLEDRSINQCKKYNLNIKTNNFYGKSAANPIGG